MTRHIATCAALAAAIANFSPAFAESYFHMGQTTRIALLVDKDSISIDGDKRTAAVLELKLFPTMINGEEYYWYERRNEFDCAKNTSRSIAVLARTKDRKKAFNNPNAAFGEWAASTPGSVVGTMQNFVCSKEPVEGVVPVPDLTAYQARLQPILVK